MAAVVLLLGMPIAGVLLCRTWLAQAKEPSDSEGSELPINIAAR